MRLRFPSARVVSPLPEGLKGTGPALVAPSAVRCQSNTQIESVNFFNYDFNRRGYGGANNLADKQIQGRETYRVTLLFIAN